MQYFTFINIDIITRPRVTRLPVLPTVAELCDVLNLLHSLTLSTNWYSIIYGLYYLLNSRTEQVARLTLVALRLLRLAVLMHLRKIYSWLEARKPVFKESLNTFAYVFRLYSRNISRMKFLNHNSMSLLASVVRHQIYHKWKLGLFLDELSGGHDGRF